MPHALLNTGDVLPARQLAADHGHEHGWEAVRLARPHARPFTGARLPKRRSMWHAFVVVSRVTAEPTGLRFREWSVPLDTLLLVRRGSDPHARRLPRSQQECHERELASLHRLLERERPTSG